MSKNKKKFSRQKRKKNFPWLPVALGGVLLLVAAFFFANREAEGTPSITVDQQQIDYGDVTFDTPKTFAIQVTNAGDGTLRFKENPYIEVVDGC